MFVTNEGVPDPDHWGGMFSKGNKKWTEENIITKVDIEKVFAEEGWEYNSRELLTRYRKQKWKLTPLIRGVK